MKQVVQNFGSGVLELLEVPCPAAGRRQLLPVKRASLISAGTERAVTNTAGRPPLPKPAKAPNASSRCGTRFAPRGSCPRWRPSSPNSTSRCHWAIPMPASSSRSGPASRTSPREIVSLNGGHAEMVSRPISTSPEIPAGVSDDAASFAVLGSIGLQGIRLLRPEIGETVAVFGLGADRAVNRANARRTAAPASWASIPIPAGAKWPDPWRHSGRRGRRRGRGRLARTGGHGVEACWSPPRPAMTNSQPRPPACRASVGGSCWWASINAWN